MALPEWVFIAWCAAFHPLKKRRVVASVVDLAAFGDHTVLGLRTTLNLFHGTSAACQGLAEGWPCS